MAILTIEHQLDNLKLMVIEEYDYIPKDGAWKILNDLDVGGWDYLTAKARIVCKITKRDKSVRINLTLYMNEK